MLGLQALSTAPLLERAFRPLLDRETFATHIDARLGVFTAPPALCPWGGLCKARSCVHSVGAAGVRRKAWSFPTRILWVFQGSVGPEWQAFLATVLGPPDTSQRLDSQ